MVYQHIKGLCQKIKKKAMGPKNFVWEAEDYILFKIPLNNFYSHGDVTITVEGLQNLGL